MTLWPEIGFGRMPVDKDVSKYSVNDLSHSRVFHHKSYADCTELERGPLG